MVEKDSTEFSRTRRAPPSISALEQSLAEIQSMYEENFGYLITEEAVEKDGIKFPLFRGAAPSIAALE